MFNRDIYDDPYGDDPYGDDPYEEQCIFDNGYYGNNPCTNCGDCSNQCIFDDTPPHVNNPCTNCGECQKN